MALQHSGKWACLLACVVFWGAVGCGRTESNYNPPKVTIVTPETEIDSGGKLKVKGEMTEGADYSGLSIFWTVAEKPARSEAGFGKTSEGLEAEFVSDKPGRYLLKLTASQSSGRGSDTLVVVARNKLPTANAGGERSAMVGETITLYSSESSDPEEEPLDRTWAYIEQEGQTPPVLIGMDTATAEFTASEIGTYSVQLTVHDGMDDGTAFVTVYIYEPSMPLPDTGQSKSFVTLHGEDYDYERDRELVAWKEKDLPAGAGDTAVMVHDTVTGLTWEIKEAADQVEDYSAPHDADNVYKWYEPNPDIDGVYVGQSNGNTTASFLKALNDDSFGGYADWRLPSTTELMTLIDYGIQPQGVNSILFPSLDTADYYWTRETSAKDDVRAIATTLEAITLYRMSLKTESNKVIAVRGGRSVLGSRYTDNGDGTITDMVTGLMWQQDIGGEGKPTEFIKVAIEACENLVLAGYDDWRLPDILELMSIQILGALPNEKQFDDLFTNTPSGGVMSSTYLEGIQNLCPAFVVLKGNFGTSSTLYYRAVRTCALPEL